MSELPSSALSPYHTRAAYHLGLRPTEPLVRTGTNFDFAGGLQSAVSTRIGQSLDHSHGLLYRQFIPRGGMIMIKRLLYVLTGLITTAAFTLSSGSAMAATTPAVAPNWAGYQATATDAHYASAQLVQPKISCAAKDSSSDVVVWVGIGSKRSFGGILPGGKTLAQVGTWAFCYKGKAGYFLFWQTIGRSASEGGSPLEPVWASPSPLTPPAACKPPQSGSENQFLAYLVDHKCTESLKAGDRLNLVAQVSAGQWANLSSYNFRTHFALNTTQKFTGVEANAANWIVESPSVERKLCSIGELRESNLLEVPGR